MFIWTESFLEHWHVFDAELCVLYVGNTSMPNFVRIGCYFLFNLETRVNLKIGFDSNTRTSNLNILHGWYCNSNELITLFYWIEILWILMMNYVFSMLVTCMPNLIFNLETRVNLKIGFNSSTKTSNLNILRMIL